MSRLWDVGKRQSNLQSSDLFSFTAARISAFRASSFTFSPSRKSIARLKFPSRLELKRPAGSSRNAPLANVIFTTLLCVSPVQIIPSCDHTGTPAGFEGFFHLHSSPPPGSACLITARSRASISPRQSSRSSIRASTSAEPDPDPGEAPPAFDVPLFFMLSLPSLIWAFRYHLAWFVSTLRRDFVPGTHYGIFRWGRAASAEL